VTQVESPTGSASDRVWLIVGHGSVGSFLARRIAAAGKTVQVYDPSPRTVVTNGQRMLSLPTGEEPAAVVVSCVSPAAAASIPELVRPVIGQDTVIFDWNTVGPEVKQRIERLASCPVVDVALLDSLDGDVVTPCVAVSGPGVERHVGLLEALGFRVAVAGEVCGDAAVLKLLRSAFMKSLEALVIEFALLADRRDTQGIAKDSISNSLGDQFGRFMDLLIDTNRIHARRRAAELAEVVAYFQDRHDPLTVAAAAAPFLERVADVWTAPSAPSVGAPRSELVRFLAQHVDDEA
jgi:3-hydroxyisobutyrate dehydrogenase-like beta-hydroxyacid dehydrogenase